MTWSVAGIDDYGIERIVFDPANEGTVYVSTHNPGVFESTDSGATWVQLEEGILYIDGTRSQHNYTFGLDVSADGEAIYAGSCGRGTFRLGDAATPITELPECPAIPISDSDEPQDEAGEQKCGCSTSTSGAVPLGGLWGMWLIWIRRRSR
jgi:uncharacterized protein (TIGR03382 family)